MAAFMHRKRPEKQERDTSTRFASQDVVDSARQPSNVLRRIKSSPLIRLVSSSPKKRDRIEEFPLPPNAPQIRTAISHQIVPDSQNFAEAEKWIVIPSSANDENAHRPDMPSRTNTDPIFHSTEEPILRVHNDIPDESNCNVGLAITGTPSGFARTLSRIPSETRAVHSSGQERRSEIGRRGSVGTIVASRNQTSVSSPQLESIAKTPSQRPESRPRGPREIRNTLELFERPLDTVKPPLLQPNSNQGESVELRRISSPLLPVETSPADEIPSTLDEIAYPTPIEPDRAVPPAQKHHDEDAMILWSLQKDRGEPISDFHPGFNSNARGINESYHQRNENLQVQRRARQEGTTTAQRSQSTSMSSSDGSSTVARGQSSTSTARQSTSAASTTTHGSPPPQYVFDRQTKHLREKSTETNGERLPSPDTSEDPQRRPQTAPEEDRRSRPTVKQQRFPVVPRMPRLPDSQSPPAALQSSQPASINPLKPTRSQTETSETTLPKSTSLPYRAPETSTFIRDASFFRPLPPYPRGDPRDQSSNGAGSCTCGRVLSPVANLTIEELRAQNAMLRAALEAVIGP